MITKEEFVKILTKYEEFTKGVENLYKSLHAKDCICECEWVDAVNMMLETTLYSHFTDLGVDYIFYYLYETIEDKRVIVTLEKNMFEEEKKIEYHLNSVEALWNFLITDKKSYFK